MSLLKNIPITYKGELHDIVLVNFSVDPDEVKDNLPEGIEVREFDGRAMISMVNVKLRNMRPTFSGKLFQFNYQHIGFRLLVNETDHAFGIDRNIFFLQSFTNRPLMALGGSMLTDYRLAMAEIFNHKLNLDFRRRSQILSYTLDLDRPVPEPHSQLKQTIGAIDSALSVHNGEVRCTQIVREKWPLEEVHCTDFKTSFFKTAHLEGVFRVPEVIHYTWLPPRNKQTYQAIAPMVSNPKKEILWQ